MDSRQLVTTILGGLAIAFLLGVGTFWTTARELAWDAFDLRLPFWVFGVMVALVAVVWLGGQRFVKRTPAPSPWLVDRVSWGGIDWEVYQPYVNSDDFTVKAPVCPTDSRTLNLVVRDVESGNEVPVPLLGIGDWRTIGKDQLVLSCPKCNRTYDLSGLGHSMRWIVDIVIEEAQGEKRARQRRLQARGT